MLTKLGQQFTATEDRSLQLAPLGAGSPVCGGPRRADSAPSLQPPPFTAWSRPGHPTCTTHEIAAALTIDERTVRYHAKQGKYGEPAQAGTHIYMCGQLPAALRAAIETGREQHHALTADDAAVSGRKIFQWLPQDFVAEELALARQKANFVLAVYRYLDAHGGRIPDAVRRVVELAEREHPFAFTNDLPTGADPKIRAGELLLSAGHNGRSAVRLDGPNFPAFENFRKWAREWQPYRRHVRDDFQYWALSRRQRVRGAQQREDYQRPGDPRFWAEFATWYETPKNISLEESYREASGKAGREKWDCPSLWVVRNYYNERMPASERRRVFRARKGRTAYYNTFAIHTERDWSGIEPNMVWSLDHHLFGCFVKQWDDDVKGWIRVRPWLTSVIDAASYFEVGSHFTTHPARTSVEFALHDALVRTHAMPDLLYFDNGKDFIALNLGLGYDEKRMIEIAYGLNVAVQFALPLNPQAKPNERDYLMVQDWWERKQPTFTGANKAELEVLWPALTREGGILHAEPVKVGEQTKYRLTNPELVPTLEEFAQMYRDWRAADRHHRASEGVVLRGQTPHQRFTAAPIRRQLTDDEIALAFLRTKGTVTLTQPRISVQPTGMNRYETLMFQDEVLMDYIGAEITIKYDAKTLRAFAFREDDEGRLIQIKGHAEAGSLERGFRPAAFFCDQEKLSAHMRQLNSWQRKSRDGRRATERLAALDVAARAKARELGITPDQARAYILQPDAGTLPATNQSGRRNAALSNTAVTDADADAWLRGEAPATEKEPAHAS